MQVIVGPRQVGKSTLIGQVLEVCNMPYDSYSADDVVGASADWLAGVWQLVCVWTYVGKGNAYWW